jgi:glycosyltransferase involved in cell wall biosynthesis
MNKRPFYSIVIPCYNSRETISDLLQSIVDQELEK